MSKLRSKLTFFAYIITLAVAIILVYQAFTTGFERGRFAGKYYPPQEDNKAVEVKKPVDLRKLRIATPELVAEGAKLYRLNCASCHGESGMGDGPKSASLNPPPRNFQTEEFKYGASVLQIYNTLTNGIQGTSMPAFDLLPEQDRMSMAHYVRTFVPDPPDDPPELVEALPVVEEKVTMPDTAKVAADTSIPKTETPSMPVERALEKILESVRAKPHTIARLPLNRIFEKHCASCHGTSGEGTIQPEQVVPSSVVYLRRGEIAGKESQIMTDYKTVEDFITGGSPGLEGHNFGFITEDELNDLFRFVKSLTENPNQAEK